jgi:cytochrome c553
MADMKISSMMGAACAALALTAAVFAAEQGQAPTKAQPAPQPQATAKVQPETPAGTPPQAAPQAQSAPQSPAAVQAQAATQQTPAAPQGNADAGRSKASMCVGCHNIPGYKTAFPAVYSVPKLDGQHAPYIVKALRAYKSGERTHPSMRAVAASLADQDMADLAAFYSNAATQSAAR